MADNAYVKELRGLMKNDAVQTLMHVVPWAEGTIDNATSRDQGYKSLFGFNEDGSRRFMDSLDFIPDSPGKYRDPVTGQIKWSHDYGLYQLNKMNIPRLQKKIGRTDFSPETQDLMFLALLDEQPGFRKAISNGDPKTWTEGQWKNLLGITGKVYNSFPNGPGKGGKRTEGFLFSKINEYLQGHGAKPVQYTGSNVSSNTTNTTNITNTTNGGTGYSFLNYARATQGVGSADSYLTQAIRSIQEKDYANPGAIPFQVISRNSGSRSVFGTMTDDPQTLVDRLFDTDPNTNYGLSFVGSSLRPTVSRNDPNGKRVNMIEYDNGTYIDADTGERRNADGSIYEGTPVELLKPDYEAPQNSPEAMEALRRNNELQAAPITDMQNEQAIVPVQTVANPGNAITGEYNYQGVTGEATLPNGNTPLTQTGSVASPVAYVSPTEQLVRALGGDAIAQTINTSRSPADLARDLLKQV